MRICLLLALLACCSSVSIVPSRPPRSVLNAESGQGRVYFSSADELADATKCATEIDRLFLATADLLGSRNEAPLEVWLNYGLRTPGRLTGGHIEFNPSGGWIEMADLVLAHELLHWHALGTAIAVNLPHYVQEGVCELLSSELVPEQGRIRTESLLDLMRSQEEQGTLGRLVARFCLDPVLEKAARPDVSLEIYALGYVLVGQIGFEVLREAAMAGPVTPEMVLEMAGVDLEGRGLRIPPAQAVHMPEPQAHFLDANGVVLQSVPLSSYGSMDLPPGTARVEVGVFRKGPD